ncbi:MAG: hypothetical protein WBY94_24400 [Polyangiaceae bacterium]
MDRYARQARLAEVGVAGQERILRTFADVPLDGAAGDVAARYLGGAGVASVRVRDGSIAEAARRIAPALIVVVDPTLAVESDGDAFDLRDPACRDLARGACVALRVLRASIGLEPFPAASDGRS